MNKRIIRGEKNNLSWRNKKLIMTTQSLDAKHSQNTLNKSNRLRHLHV